MSLREQEQDDRRILLTKEGPLGIRLGRQIRALREAKRYTGEELAELCGVQKPQISKIERDASHASAKLLLKIAEIFETELSFIDPLLVTPDLFLSRLGSVTDLFKNYGAARTKLHEDMRKAKELRLLLIRGLELQGGGDPALRNILEKQEATKRIRVLLLHPRSPHVSSIEKILSLPSGVFQRGIMQTLAVLKDIGSIAKGELSCRLYDELPAWRLIFADGIVYVASYSDFPEAAATRNVHYRIAKKARLHGSLFHFFESYFENLWYGRSSILGEYPRP